MKQHAFVNLMTGSLDVMPKTTEQNLIVCIGKFAAKVTNSKRVCSRYCNVDADTKHRTTSL